MVAGASGAEGDGALPVFAFAASSAFAFDSSLRDSKQSRRSPGLVAGEQIGGRAPARLLLIVDVRECRPGSVLDDEGGAVVLDGPRRREAAGCHADRRRLGGIAGIAQRAIS